jgi:hypothetical protein
MTDDNAITELRLLGKGCGVQTYGILGFLFPLSLHNYGVKGWEGYMQVYTRQSHRGRRYRLQVKRSTADERNMGILDGETVYRRIP